MTNPSPKIEQTSTRSWLAYRDAYRATEMKLLAGWIASGVSGAVVGLPGCGRSNVLGFLCYRPEIFNAYLPAQAKRTALVLIDMHDLLDTDISIFYRIVLRSIYRVREHYDPHLQQTITTIYQTYCREQDPFLTQSALQELLLAFQAEQMQVVLVLNHFDHFSQIATLPMVNALRSLRDGFKDMLSYLVGMSQEAAYLPNPTILGDMYDLVDSHVCWVGAMHEQDATDLIARATRAAPTSPSTDEIAFMIVLTGGFPSLLKATCYWWTAMTETPAKSQWVNLLLAEPSIQHRLAQIWEGLTQEEQLVLSQLQKYEANMAQTVTPTKLEAPSQDNESIAVLKKLTAKGILYKEENGRQIAGELLAHFIAQGKRGGRGKIWQNESTGELYQDQTPITTLTALERDVLSFLIRNPRVRHTKTELIVNTWPDELSQKGVSDNSLYQVILNIRKAIEPNLSQPRYLINWRGKPEGGYQFFPEGRPG